MQNIALPLRLFIREGLLQMRQQFRRLSVDRVELMHGEDSNPGLLDIRTYLPKIRRQAEEGTAQSIAPTVHSWGDVKAWRKCCQAGSRHGHRVDLTVSCFPIGSSHVSKQQPMEP